jgi:hypothetical protein
MMGPQTTVIRDSACGLSAEPSEMLNGTILLLARRDHAQHPSGKDC